MRARQAGFTLIELVIVITILGLMAGIALPRFASLQADARLAKMQAAMGSVKASAAMAHATLLTKGHSASFSGTPDPAIVIEGVSVEYAMGYPTLDSIRALAGLDDDYVVTGLTAPRVAAAGTGHVGATTATDCTIGYAPPTVANERPVYTMFANADTCS